MSDQAEKLRQLIHNGNLNENTSQILPGKGKSARVITITSGKGGVGKTNLAVNLGIAFSKMGKSVVILDVDFGLANIDVLFGIVPKFTLVDLIREEKNIFEVLTDGPNNIKFLSGGSGVEELLRLDRRQIRKFVENISLLDRLYDYIIIDTGAGISQNVMSFIMAADEIVLVTTPEPTAITDAYALVKMVSFKDKRKIIRVVVNKAENIHEAQDILTKLSMVSDRFLSLKLHQLGYILNDDLIPKSVKQQKPFSLVSPKSPPTRQVWDIALQLVQEENEDFEFRGGVKNFINRLLQFFNG